MKRLLKILAVIVILIVVAAVALPFLVNPDQFRPLLESKLSDALGRQVTLGNLQLSILSGSVTATNLSIGDDPAFSPMPFVQAQSVSIGVELMPLIVSRKLNVTGITIQSPDIHLIQNRSGIWNFSDLGDKSAKPKTSAPSPSGGELPNLSVDSIKIAGGRLVLSKASSRTPLILDHTEIQVTGFSPASSFPFSMTANLNGGGQIKLDGKAGPFNTGDAIATPLEATLHVTHLDFNQSGLLDPSYGVAGIVSMDGSAKSARAMASVQAKVKGEQLRLIKGGTPAKSTAEIDLTLEHDLKTRSGRISRLDLHLGKDVATVTGSYNIAGEVPEVNLKASGRGLAVTELAAFLPPLNIELPAGAAIQDGTAEFEMSAGGPLDRLTEDGSFAFHNTRLANYDMGSKMKVIEALAGINEAPTTEIQTLSADLKAAQGDLTAQNIVFVVPSIGAIAGAGTVSPEHALDFKMRVALRTTTPPTTGGIPFLIQGTSSKPEFRPDVKGMVKGELSDLKGQGKSAAGDLIRGLLGGKK